VESQYINRPTDQRRLSDKDKNDFRRGAAQEENKRHRRIKARTAAINYRNSQPPKTGSQEGKGGFLRGREVQQMRLREIGNENRRAQALRNIQ